MNQAPYRVCQLCGFHPANHVTFDQEGNACWYCGYCHRWHLDDIAAFLHVKRLFSHWKGRAMKQSQSMQAIIEALATKHGVSLQVVDAALKLTLPAYMPLVIRHVGVNRVSVYHYFMAHGDIVPDPYILFWVTQDGWYPIEVTQTMGGHRAYAYLNDAGTVVSRVVAPKAQADLAEFADLWATNLQEQGWLERGEQMPPALFPLGTVFLTLGAQAALDTIGMDPHQLIQRHVTGDWAAMNEHDRGLNQLAVQNADDRVFSVYGLTGDVTIWVITEADRSSTTLLLPQEY
jgi:hypothetical protein